MRAVEQRSHLHKFLFLDRLGLSDLSAMRRGRREWQEVGGRGVVPWPLGACQHLSYSGSELRMVLGDRTSVKGVPVLTSEPGSLNTCNETKCAFL